MRTLQITVLPRSQTIDIYLWRSKTEHNGAGYRVIGAEKMRVPWGVVWSCLLTGRTGRGLERALTELFRRGEDDDLDVVYRSVV